MSLTSRASIRLHVDKRYIVVVVVSLSYRSVNLSVLDLLTIDRLQCISMSYCLLARCLLVLRRTKSCIICRHSCLHHTAAVVGVSIEIVAMPRLYVADFCLFP